MNKDIILIVIGLIAFLLLMLAFVIDYVDLEQFRDCYEINFQNESCEKYKNY